MTDHLVSSWSRMRAELAQYNEDDNGEGSTHCWPVKNAANSMSNAKVETNVANNALNSSRNLHDFTVNRRNHHKLGPDRIKAELLNTEELIVGHIHWSRVLRRDKIICNVFSDQW